LESDEFDSALQYHLRCGVGVISKDVIGYRLEEEVVGSFDAINSFDGMEHLHNSPGRQSLGGNWQSISSWLFVLVVPLFVRARKQLIVPVGIGRGLLWRTKYKLLGGYAREGDLSELKYITQGLRIKKTRYLGVTGPVTVWRRSPYSRPFRRIFP
jgi:hypothetical protein